MPMYEYQCTVCTHITEELNSIDKTTIQCPVCDNTAERKVKSLQEKQGEIDNILDQYIAEIINRNISGANGFSIVNNTSLAGFLAHDVHNDKLVQSTYTMTVELDSDCITGTFTY